MVEPRIAVESREQYHGKVKGTINDFHLGHFRVVKRDFPRQHNQVIHEEFYSTGIESDGTAPIYCEGLCLRRGLRVKVPEKYLSQTSYALAMAEALKLSKKTGFGVDVKISKDSFSLEKAASS
jgi:hypothetical protein